MTGLGKAECTIPHVSKTSDGFYSGIKSIKNWADLLDFKLLLDQSDKMYDTAQWMPHQDELDQMAAAVCRPPDYVAKSSKKAKADALLNEIAPAASENYQPKFKPLKPKPVKPPHANPHVPPAPKPALSDDDPHPFHSKYSVKKVREAKSAFGEVAKDFAAKGKPAGYASKPCVVCTALEEASTDHNTLDCTILKPKDRANPSAGSKHPRDPQSARGARSGRGGRGGRGRGRGGYPKSQ
jgi:hypothetical protein